MKANKKLLEQFGQLNKELSDITAKREKWKKDNMAAFAEYEIGERLYNLDTCEKIGTVDSYYLLFDSMIVDYTIHTGGNSYTNTTGLDCSYGNKKELVSFLESKLGGLAEE